jgi:sulfite reductase (NADPH) flavoprotein alpha-component
MSPLLPESAPFTAEQRAWLNGFFAALFGAGRDAVLLPAASPGMPLPAASAMATAAGAAVADDGVAVTWKDPTLTLETRMERARGLALPHRLHAAMGQQDCGQCGYLCASYAQALHEGSETDTTLCVPGGRETRRKLKELLLERAAPKADGPAVASPSPSAAGVGPGRSRQQPVRARLIETTPLHAVSEERDTRHVAIALPPGAPGYAPGDALGVLPRNDPELVARLLTRLGLAGAAASAPATAASGPAVEERLATELDITKPSDECLELLASSAEAEAERELLLTWLREGPEEGVDLLEILERCPGLRPDPDRLLASLARLQPRLYSIASSPDARPGVVELTVGVVRYERGGRRRHGVASGCLARARPGETELDVYLQPNTHFRLPADPAVPIVMVGPGTGIAPFRGFLQARAQLPSDRRGPAWLFFGNPHAARDFLYQRELEGWLADGTLSRLSTAFSRDQADKVYVQHRMREEGALLWHWLQEDAACFYVCGDAKRMAGDVEAALLEIAAHEGGLAPEAARQWLAGLAQGGRYRRDVY